METAVRIFGFLMLAYLIGYVLYIVYYIFGLIQFNPFVKNKELSSNDRQILRRLFPISHHLSEEEMVLWYRRTVWFWVNKKYHYKVKIQKENELELILAATAALLTLGLKSGHRMMRSYSRIVIRPNKYYSRLTRSDHWGEYHPMAHTVVFSADRLIQGFEDPKDHLNLAFHEFAHALCFEMLRRNSWEARRFKVGLQKMKDLVEDPVFVETVKSSKLIREYGQTNMMEFFSVAVETYMENPQEVSVKLPQLHFLLVRMLNFDFSKKGIPSFSNL